MIRPIERSFYWKMNTILFLDKNFIKLLKEQTDLLLKFNDQDEIDPRLVWDA